MKDLIIHGRERDIGGFKVYRALPYFSKKSVGPFVFLDHMGPIKINEKKFLNVRPHPHIGLATVTYLFEGKAFHRDSIGSEQILNQGDLNWMTAGRGIVHSERTPKSDRNLSQSLHGVQIWVGLPINQEECEPNFTHWPKEKLPDLQISSDFRVKLLLGEYKGNKSPIPTLWKTLFLDCFFNGGSNYNFSFTEKEIGFFIASGECEIDGNIVSKDDLVVVSNPKEVLFRAQKDTRFVVIGGEPFPEPRFIWWNFVSSKKERILKAANDWNQNKIGQIEGESDIIPLPEKPPFK